MCLYLGPYGGRIEGAEGVPARDVAFSDGTHFSTPLVRDIAAYLHSGRLFI